MGAIIQRIAGNGAGRIQKGSANGFVVTRDPALNTNIIITSGVYEVSGKEYVLQANSIHSMTSLAVGLDLHYIYLDVSLSSLSSPVFYDETTESVFDPVKNGEYHPINTEDRSVGVLTSAAGTATVSYFDTVVMSGHLIRNIYPDYAANFSIAASQNPNGAYQTPNVAESSIFVPVNAIEIYVWMENTDNASIEWSWLNNEAAAVFTVLSQSPTYRLASVFMFNASWGALGPSRNIKIGAPDLSDNNLGAEIVGYGYRR